MPKHSNLTDFDGLLAKSDILRLEILQEDCQYLEAEDAYLAIFAVDTPQLGEHIQSFLQGILPNIYVEDPEKAMQDLRNCMEQYAQQKTPALLPLYALANKNHQQIAHKLIGPRDAINYLHLKLFLVVDTLTYNAIFNEAYDLISFANFVAALHDQQHQIEQDFASPSEKTDEELQCEKALADVEEYRKNPLQQAPILLEYLHELRGCYQNLGRYQEGAKTAKEMLKIAQKHRLIYWEAEALYQIGLSVNTYSSIESLSYLQKSLIIFKRLKLRGDEAKVHRELGNMMGKNGKYEDALKHLEKAQTFFEEDQDHFSLNYVNLDKAEIIHQQGKYNEASNIYQKALEKGVELNDHSLQIGALNELGKIHKIKENYKESLHKHHQALELCKKHKNKGNLSWSLYYIGSVHLTCGEYTLAKIYFDQVQALAYHQKDTILINVIKASNGSYQFSQGNFNIALQYFLEALQVFKTELHAHNLGLLQNNTAFCYIHLEQLAEAEKHNAAAIKIFEKLKNDSLLASCWYNTLLIAHKKGETKKVGELSKKVFEIYSKEQSKLDLAILYNFWAYMALEEKQAQKAIEHLTASRKLLASLKSLYSEAQNYEYFAEAYEMLGDKAEAKKYAYQAYDIYKQLPNKKRMEAIQSLLERIDLQS